MKSRILVLVGVLFGWHAFAQSTLPKAAELAILNHVQSEKFLEDFALSGFERIKVLFEVQAKATNPDEAKNLERYRADFDRMVDESLVAWFSERIETAPKWGKKNKDHYANQAITLFSSYPRDMFRTDSVAPFNRSKARLFLLLNKHSGNTASSSYGLMAQFGLANSMDFPRAQVGVLNKNIKAWVSQNASTFGKDPENIEALEMLFQNLVENPRLFEKETQYSLLSVALSFDLPFFSKRWEAFFAALRTLPREERNRFVKRHWQDLKPVIEDIKTKASEEDVWKKLVFGNPGSGPGKDSNVWAVQVNWVLRSAGLDSAFKVTDFHSAGFETPEFVVEDKIHDLLTKELDPYYLSGARSDIATYDYAEAVLVRGLTSKKEGQQHNGYNTVRRWVFTGDVRKFLDDLKDSSRAKTAKSAFLARTKNEISKFILAKNYGEAISLLSEVDEIFVQPKSFDLDLFATPPNEVSADMISELIWNVYENIQAASVTTSISAADLSQFLGRLGKSLPADKRNALRKKMLSNKYPDVPLILEIAPEAGTTVFLRSQNALLKALELEESSVSHDFHWEALEKTIGHIDPGDGMLASSMLGSLVKRTTWSVSKNPNTDDYSVQRTTEVSPDRPGAVLQRLLALKMFGGSPALVLRYLDYNYSGKLSGGSTGWFLLDPTGKSFLEQNSKDRNLSLDPALASLSGFRFVDSQKKFSTAELEDLRAQATKNILRAIKTRSKDEMLYLLAKEEYPDLAKILEEKLSQKFGPHLTKPPVALEPAKDGVHEESP